VGISVGASVAVEAGVGVSATVGKTTTVAVGRSGVGEATGAVVALAVATGGAAKLQDVKKKAAARQISINLKKTTFLLIGHLLTI